MDTHQLKVGQCIRVNGGGSFFYQGRVTKLTPDSVEVQPDNGELIGPPLRFDSNGVAYRKYPRMDIKEELAPIPDFAGTLKIGQTVLLKSGPWYGCEAKVLEIGPTGFIVEQIKYPGKPFRLDINGRAVDSRDLGWNEGRIYNDALPVPGTFEGGPWHIE